MTLCAVGSDDRMLRSKFFVVCKCPAGWDTINFLIPGPRDASCKKYPVFARGGCSRQEVTRTLEWVQNLGRLWQTAKVNFTRITLSKTEYIFCCISIVRVTFIHETHCLTYMGKTVQMLCYLTSSLLTSHRSLLKPFIAFVCCGVFAMIHEQRRSDKICQR